jgi:hypothetical protein
MNDKRAMAVGCGKLGFVRGRVHFTLARLVGVRGKQKKKKKRLLLALSRSQGEPIISRRYASVGLPAFRVQMANFRFQMDDRAGG